VSGLSVVCQVGPLVKARGVTLQLKGRTLRHLGEAESQILLLRGDLCSRLAFAVRHCDNGPAKDFCVQVLQRYRSRWIGCTGGDIQRFYSTLEGRIFSFWQSVRHSGKDYDWCHEAYCEMCDTDPLWEPMIKRGIETASGESDICKMYKVTGTYRDKGGGAEDNYLICRADLFASLFANPYCYHPDEVADMTLGQVGMLLAGMDNSREDVRMEASLRSKVKKNIGMRAMMRPYDRVYGEMATNLVDGLPVMSGLTS